MSGGTMAASLAMAAVAAVASHMQAEEQASQQASHQQNQQAAYNAAAVQNANNAIKEQTERSAAERTQQMQEQASAAREAQAAQVDFLEKKGTAQASNAYGGGAAMDALMADYNRGLALAKGTIQEQLDMQGVGHDVAVRGYRDTAVSRITSQQGYVPAPVSRPNPWVSALGFGSQALNTWNQGTNYGKSKPWDKAAPKQ